MLHLRDVLKKWLPISGLLPYFAVAQSATLNPVDQKWFIWLCRMWYEGYHPMWAMLEIKDDRLKAGRHGYFSTVLGPDPDRGACEFMAADPKFFEKVTKYLKARKVDYAHQQLDIPLRG
jgi:hypothetical protein